jgi:predicted O-methyltransferase YrrM
MRLLKRMAKGFASLPVMGRVLLVPFRLLIALRYSARPTRDLLVWLVRSREYTNFTYDLTPQNRRYLTAFAANVAGITYEQSAKYLQELEEDGDLREGILGMMRRSPQRAFCDPWVEYGRRLGWYIVARAAKPRVIVETGVEKGLGACVLTAALRRNRLEGHLGRYYGTDIDPNAGSLLPVEYRSYGEILLGDSVASLKAFSLQVDLFIHDSDHSEAYETIEYATIESKLSPHAIVLSDNSKVTEALLDFARRTNRVFHFFAEFPDRHWYPGAGIGAATRPSVETK